MSPCQEKVARVKPENRGGAKLATDKKGDGSKNDAGSKDQEKPKEPEGHGETERPKGGNDKGALDALMSEATALMKSLRPSVKALP